MYQKIILNLFAFALFWLLFYAFYLWLYLWAKLKTLICFWYVSPPEQLLRNISSTSFFINFQAYFCLGGQLNLSSLILWNMIFSSRIHLLYQNRCFDKSVFSSYICRNDSLCQPLDYSTIKDLRSSNIQTVMTFNRSISFCNQVS